MPFPTPTLQTARLLLRPFAEGDAEAIYALQSNARVLRCWDSPPRAELAQADAFISASRSIGIGYCFDEPVWGKGYATEAVRAMLQWAYGALDLNRVEAELDTRNAASARVLEKLGFEREGLRREDCIVSGEVSDSWIYGLLRRDWKADPGAVLVTSEDRAHV